MPIVEIGRVFRKLEVGEQLQVEADDPAFRADVEAWARRTKQKIVSIEEDGTIIATIEKVSE